MDMKPRRRMTMDLADLRYIEHYQSVQKSQPGYSRSDHPEDSFPREGGDVGDRAFRSLSH
jgi:hypothetical protein